MNKILTGCLLVVSASAALAGTGQYHICTDADGKKTFTSSPCANNQKAETKSYDVPSGTPGTKRLSVDNPIYQQMKSDNRKAEIKRAVKNGNKKIELNSKKMESELDSLKKKKLRANNNSAGAAWEISISEEMRAVTSKYKALIDVERDKIDALRDELATL